MPLSGVASSARQDTIPVSPGISHNMNAGISLETRRLQTQQTGVFRHKPLPHYYYNHYYYFTATTTATTTTTTTVTTTLILLLQQLTKKRCRRVGSHAKKKVSESCRGGTLPACAAREEMPRLGIVNTLRPIILLAQSMPWP